jgi:putative DNA primase/helicase
MPDFDNTSGRGGQGGEGTDFTPKVIPIADARMRLEKLEPKVAPGQAGAEGNPKSEWPAPRPLPNGLLPVKPFDLAMVPAAFAPWIEDIAERMQCPPDYPAISAMVALGAAIGGKIGIRPKRHDDWLIVPNLWGCIIGPPGYMKSPAMNEVLKPPRRLEAKRRRGTSGQS